MEQPLVTVSLLVSNRKDTIRKCMESIKPLLDAVPSELIAVDTVGEENSDGSLAIVKEYTGKIIRFPWCNDFAAARNAGLNAANGKWFLFLDDDEWFEDITPIIRFFLDGDYKNYDRAWYYVRNYHNFGGTEYVDTFADRMCPITPETRFVSRVHEYLLPYPSKVMQFFCYVHHYGYVYKNQEDKEAHSVRNTTLMELELQEHPDDPRMAGQLVQEYALVGRYTEAQGLCKTWLEKYKTQLANPFAQYLVVMLLRLSNEAGNADETAELFFRIEKTYSLKEIPRLACLAESIRAEGKRENYAAVLEKVREYFALRETVLNKESQVAVQQVFDLRKYVTEEYVQTMIAYGLVAVLQSQQYDMAKELFERIPWTDEENKPFGAMVQLIEIYGKSGISELFFPYAEQIINNPQMKKPFLVSLEGLIRDYSQRKEAVSAWLQRFTGPVQKQMVNPELQKLAEQLKQNIKVLLEAGKVAEAKELLTALKEILPEEH